jgi:hypothetical protein
MRPADVLRSRVPQSLAGAGNQYNHKLTADDEALDERLRKVRAAHALLYRSNVVRHAPKFDGVMLKISNSEAGPRIAIAWLTDGTGIKQIAA